MKLQSFRITQYRNIRDSGWIEIEDPLTCIVGKNQSGKTALLRALHGLNPTEQRSMYDIERDWPRSDRDHKDGKQVVCTATFALEEFELTELHNRLGITLRSPILVVTRNYDGAVEITFPNQPELLDGSLHPNAVDEIVERLEGPHLNAGQPFRNTAQRAIQELQSLAREGRFTELLACCRNHDQLLREQLPPSMPQRQRASDFCEAHRSALDRIVAAVEQLLTTRRAVHDYVITNTPRFIYMDEFREFSGSALLTEIQDRLAKNASTVSDTTFLMLLAVAKLNLAKLIDQGMSNESAVKPQRAQDLADASRRLTECVAGRWHQRPYKIQFYVDGQTFFTQIQSEANDGDMIPLEEQSKGFRWFFSFDLRFMHESKGTFKNCVLLLDEPGLHLHPGGQKDLMDRLDEYAKTNTLLYTTHLPFLVDLREPHRIKVIREGEDGATVSADLGSVGRDEKLTLQAALGMRLDQNPLVSTDNLVLEGAHDYWIIAGLANLFERSGEAGLPDEVMVTAAGGASFAVTLSAFMIGQGLHVATLFDSDDEGKRHESQLRTKWITRYKGNSAQTFLLGTILGTDADVAIEDIFDDDYYLECAEMVYQDELGAAGARKISLEGTGPLCERVNRAYRQAGIAFNKGSVAKVIRKRLSTAKSVADLPPTTQERARRLLQTLRHAFLPAKGATPGSIRG